MTKGDRDLKQFTVILFIVGLWLLAGTLCSGSCESRERTFHENIGGTP